MKVLQWKKLRDAFDLLGRLLIERSRSHLTVYVRRSSLFILCAVLAACADGTAPRGVAAPDDGLDYSLTAPVGNEVFPLLPGAAPLDPAPRPSVRPLGALLVGTQVMAARAETFARGSGQVDINYLSARQTYSFTAMSSGLSPGATGRLTVSIVHATYSMEIDAAVNCVITVGNEAWVSGPVERFVFNGVARAATIHLYLRLQDNGEAGSASPDLVSPPFGAGPQACLLMSALPVLPNAAGNVQLISR